MRVVYLGTRGPLSIRPLEAILASGHEVVGVILPFGGSAQAALSLEPPIPPVSSLLPLSDRWLRPSLASVASKHGVPVFRARKLSGADGVRILKGLAPDVLCIRRRHRYADPAGPFPEPDGRLDHGRRRSLRLSFQTGLRDHGNATDGFRDAVQTRKSVRGFKREPVARAVIEDIIEVAKRAHRRR